MPTVYNGIGTWYYGKRRIHRIKATCKACGSLGELESYDTTLFFVVLFVPIVPIGSKRILDSCPSCQQHRYMKLTDWEKARSNVLADLTNSLQAGANRSEAIINALGAAWTFQDEQILDQIALLAREQPEALVHQELGRTYGYFSRWPEAEATHRRAIQIENTPERQDLLSLTLLKQGRPDEVLSNAKTILAERDAERAWVVELMIEAYQAAGRHEEALKLMDARDEAFPDAVTEFAKIQRTLSEKNLASGKAIRSAYLSDSKKAGYREGGGWLSKAPRIIGPALALGLLFWYLGAAWWIGENRKVHLLNGGKQPYKVVINGTEATVAPGRPTTVRIPEGDLAIGVDGADVGEVPPARIETSFFSRPFKSHTFVVNPDRLAAIQWEEVEYTRQKGGGKARPSKVHMGEVLHHFEGLDYEFKPFPGTLEMKGESILKERIDVLPFDSIFTRAMWVREAISAEKQPEYVRQLVRMDPDDSEALYWLTSLITPEELVKELKTRLADRPIRMEWHRLYQSTQESLQPDLDLRPEYRKLVEDEKRSADALYLLGRIEDDTARLALYNEAVTTTPPSVAAMVSLGYCHLAAGDFEDGFKWLKKANEAKPDDPRCKRYYRDGLLATGNYRQLAEDTTDFGKDPRDLGDHLIALHAAKDEMAAEAAVRRYETANGIPQNEAFTRWSNTVAAQTSRDRARFLELAKKSEGGTFAIAILEGRPRDAADALKKVPTSDTLAARHYRVQAEAIICVAAEKAGDKALGEEHSKRVLELLSKEGKDERKAIDVLVGRKPFDFDTFRNMVMNIEVKRFIALMLANRNPDHAEKLREFSGQLNFHRDTEGLCLAALLDK